MEVWCSEIMKCWCVDLQKMVCWCGNCVEVGRWMRYGMVVQL